MKRIIAKVAVIVLVCICLYMIAIGAQAHASQPIQDCFLHPLHEELSHDPHTYLKGVVVPDKVELDFSQVDIDKPGTYQVRVTQPGGSYEFSICVE